MTQLQPAKFDRFLCLMRSLHAKYHWMSAVDPLYLMCCLVSVCINECSHLSVSGELERKSVCVFYRYMCFLVCVYL